MSLSVVRSPRETPRIDAPCLYCIGIGTLEATDLFCGAGGSSLGLEFVCCPRCGRQLIQVTQALNHWALAVEAHNANFPHADHDLHDVEIVPASRFRRTDLLWASPECVHHAYCRGRKSDDDSAKRSRMTMHDVVRFTRYHRYDAVIVENVVEARLWEPFEAWFDELCALGYEGQIVFFNSQFALPTPQSRDRMYVVFWRKGARRPNLHFRPSSWCTRCSTVVRGIQTWKPASKGSCRTRPGMFEWGRYGAQYVYTCPECSYAVAPAVMGARTIIDWSLDTTRIGDRKKPLAVKTRQRIRNGLERLATTEPVTVQVGGHLYERPGYARVWSVNDPLRAVTGTRCMGLLVPVGGQTGQQRRALELDEPVGTVTSENHRAVVVRAGGQNGKGRPVDEPLGTIIGSDRQLALILQNMENNAPRDVDEPTPPVTTGGNHMLVQVNRGGNRGGRRAFSAEEPTPTIAGHGELAIVSFRENGGVSGIDEPARTVTAGGYHHGLLVYNGNPGFVRDLEDAAGTITGRDKQSLLVPYYSTGVAHPIGEPMGAITSKDRQALVVTDADVDDCLFRMLQWPELLAAQQMHVRPDGSPYLLTARRRNKRGQMVELSNELRVKMIGNAVSSPVATMLGYAVVDSLLLAA